MHCGANTKVVIPSFSVTMALRKRKKLNKKTTKRTHSQTMALQNKKIILKKLQKGLTATFKHVKILKRERCGKYNKYWVREMIEMQIESGKMITMI